MRLPSRVSAAVAASVLVAGALRAWALPIAFLPPANVSELNTPHSDRNPTLTADGLEVFFVSDRPGGLGDYDIWRATRPDGHSSFNTPVNVGELNTPGRDVTPAISPDGLTLYFARGWTGHTESYDVYAATRPDRASPFGTPQEVAELNSLLSDGAPFAAADDLTIYLVHNADFPPPREDLYVAQRTTQGEPFGAPVRIDELSTDDMERDLWVSADGLAVYFVSNRGGVHFGDYDIFLSERDSTGEPFGAPERTEGINSAEHDGSPFFDASRGMLYFHSNGLGGQGDVDIWVARPIPEPATSLLLLAGLAALVTRRRHAPH